jgi:hypothetical protein
MQRNCISEPDLQEPYRDILLKRPVNYLRTDGDFCHQRRDTEIGPKI